MSDRLVDAHQRALRRLRLATAAAVTTAWDRLGSWDQVDADRFVDQIVPIVTAAQGQAASLTDAYLSMRLGEPTIGIEFESVTSAAVRRGTAADVVYQRPFVSLWTALKAHEEFATAALAARNRLALTSRTDVQLAMRESSRQRLEASTKVTGYRRALTGTESCGFCAVASTQRYRKKDLMPLHPGCDCTVIEIIGTRDPGRVINRERLDAVYAQAAGSTDRSRLSHLRVDADGKPILPDVVTIDHGELGPTLADASHKHTLL